jgi:hypothetical protein
VNGLKYARDVAKAVQRYKQTSRSVQCFPELFLAGVERTVEHRVSGA